MIETVASLDVDPARMIRELRELHKITGGPDGSQRLAWTRGWDTAREWLTGQLRCIGVNYELDEAHNLWAESPGEAGSPVIAIGSHLDSVPNGGWLDGALGVVAGLEILRSSAQREWQGATIRLVDWSDEEGARFGYSTFGSSAAAGLLDGSTIEHLIDSAGARLDQTLRMYGVELHDVAAAASRLDDLDALLELHIEQGPILEDAGVSVGIPSGAVEVRRFAVRFRGQAAHAGTTPMDHRHDAAKAAARVILDVSTLASNVGVLATCGSVQLNPGIATAVAQEAEVTVDLRAESASEMNSVLGVFRSMIDQIATAELVETEIEELWSFPATSFDQKVVGVLRESAESYGTTCSLVSGALHDAVAVSRAKVPVGMVFVRSIGGISHSKLEDSLEGDLVLGLRVLATAVERLSHELRSGV